MEKTMHPTMIRVYEAAKTLKGIVGQSNLAVFINSAPQRINNWETRGISSEGAKLASSLIGCSLDYILNGSGDMVAGETGHASQEKHVVAQNIEPYITRTVQSRNIPSFTIDQIKDTDKIRLEDAKVWAPLKSTVKVSASAFETTIVDDSMEPALEPGDSIVVEPQLPHRPGMFVLARTTTDIIARQYTEREVTAQGLVFELVPKNRFYPTIKSDVTDIKIIGVIVQVTKNMKT